MKAGGLLPLSFYSSCNRIDYQKTETNMRPIEQLTNVERAKLLYDLFKPEISAVLRFTKNSAVILQDQQDLFRSKWESPLFTFDAWLSLAACIGKKIDQYGVNLEKSRAAFSEELFGGYHFLFMVHCLDQYSKVHTPKSEKFAQAVDLLFN